MTKEDYAWFKSRGLCPHCGQKVELNRCACSDCLEKQAERFRDLRKDPARRQKINEEQNIRKKRLRLKRKEEGKCPRCGKKVNDGHVQCLECRIRLRKEKQARYKPKKTIFEDGLCAKCDEPVYKGKLCKAHYDACTNNLKHTGCDKNHIWQRYIKADVAMINVRRAK